MQRRIKPMTLHHAGQWALQHTTAYLIHPQNLVFMNIDTFKPYSLLVLMALTFIQGHNCAGKQKLLIFLEIYQSVWMQLVFCDMLVCWSLHQLYLVWFIFKGKKRA